MPKMLRQDNGEIYVWHPVLAARSDMTEYWADEVGPPPVVVDKPKRTRKKAVQKKTTAKREPVTIDAGSDMFEGAD